MKTITLVIAILGFVTPGMAQSSNGRGSQRARSSTETTNAPDSSETSNADEGKASDVDQIEGMFKDEQREDVFPTPVTEKRSGFVENLNAVRRLEPFRDIAVIQRRFLPKSKRFELFGGAGLVMNDAFFNNLGFMLRGGYNFSESSGIEILSLSISTSDKDITKDLQGNKNVTTETLVSPISYLGVDYKWTPWYGKISWLNRSIVPLDHYFTIGGGNTTTNQGASAPTLHLGTGQSFAISKRFAYRWDLSWMFYNTTSQVSGATQSASYNNLYLTMGLSWFFPEAKYR